MMKAIKLDIQSTSNPDTVTEDITIDTDNVSCTGKN
jgi:hypothetical protein